MTGIISQQVGFVERVQRLPQTTDEIDGWLEPYVIESIKEIELYPPFPFPRFAANAPVDWQEVDSWFVALHSLSDRTDIKCISVKDFLHLLKEIVSVSPDTGFAITAWGPKMVLVSAYEVRRE